jgi:mannonate dehydratase
LANRISPSRRNLLLTLGGLGIATAAWRYWPEDGLVNPCRPEAIPESLLQHDLVKAAWSGIDPTQFWDCHVHLVGTGDSGSGVWVNPNMQSVTHPVQWAQYVFYLNASCIEKEDDMDRDYIRRLRNLMAPLPEGVKLMLLAFDYFHDESGERHLEGSAFHAPDAYAAMIAQEYPDQFEWIASIHPYRRDAVEALHLAHSQGARAVKWLPPAQGMDPASPLCDPFYQAAAELDIPLLVHAGTELALHGANTEDFGNPLRLRRALDRGVRVLVAHCASLGTGQDLDAGPGAPSLPSFELFSRMMDEPGYQGLLFGDISAVTQVNRAGNVLAGLLQREEWRSRLVNGSDYPLPGILPLFSLKLLERSGFINAEESTVLSEIRNYNPLLFDFVLKRTLRYNERSLGVEPFHTRRFFQPV